MTEPATPAPVSGARVWIWIAITAAACLWQGPKWATAMRPASGYFFDFSQEWLSGRNFLAGQPAYSPQGEAIAWHTEYRPQRAEDMLPWNAHPPVAILVGLPFCTLPYETAHLVWNAFSISIFLLAVLIAVRLRARPLGEIGIFQLVTLIVICVPLQVQTYQGQLNGVLVLLVVLAWAADRAGKETLAGALVGVAAAIKLVPAFLVVYWVARGRWRAVFGCAVAWLTLNGIALALFGLEAFRTYVTVIIPSVSAYRSSWDNISLSGLWFKLFDPMTEKERVLPLLQAPWLAQGLAIACQLLVTGLVFRRCRQASTRAQRDHALAIAVVGMLLVSPITWGHYLLVLLVPLAVPTTKPASLVGRTAWFTSLAMFWIPIAALAAPSMGIVVLKQWNTQRYALPEATPHQTLTGLAIQTYALVVYFLCVYFTYPKSDGTVRE